MLKNSRKINFTPHKTSLESGLQQWNLALTPGQRHCVRTAHTYDLLHITQACVTSKAEKIQGRTKITCECNKSKGPLCVLNPIQENLKFHFIFPGATNIVFEAEGLDSVVLTGYIHPMLGEPCNQELIIGMHEFEEEVQETLANVHSRASALDFADLGLESLNGITMEQLISIMEQAGQTQIAVPEHLLNEMSNYEAMVEDQDVSEIDDFWKASILPPSTQLKSPIPTPTSTSVINGAPKPQKKGVVNEEKKAQPQEKQNQTVVNKKKKKKKKKNKNKKKNSDNNLNSEEEKKIKENLNHPIMEGAPRIQFAKANPPTSNQIKSEKMASTLNKSSITTATNDNINNKNNSTTPEEAKKKKKKKKNKKNNQQNVKQNSPFASNLLGKTEQEEEKTMEEEISEQGKNKIEKNNTNINEEGEIQKGDQENKISSERKMSPSENQIDDLLNSVKDSIFSNNENSEKNIEKKKEAKEEGTENKKETPPQGEKQEEQQQPNKGKKRRRRNRKKKKSKKQKTS